MTEELTYEETVETYKQEYGIRKVNQWRTKHIRKIAPELMREYLMATIEILAIIDEIGEVRTKDIFSELKIKDISTKDLVFWRLATDTVRDCIIN